jgi:hypothetical protein
MVRIGAAVLTEVVVGEAFGMAEPLGLPEAPGWDESDGRGDGSTDSSGVGMGVGVGATVDTGEGVGVA